jgi:hypothetical protein
LHYTSLATQCFIHILSFLLIHPQLSQHSLLMSLQTRNRGLAAGFNTGTRLMSRLRLRF